MQRGTRVGQAYVAITADGDGINEAIVEGFDDVDYREIGDRHGDEYAKRIRAHLQGLDKDFDAMSSKAGKNISSRLSKAIETESALNDGVSRTLAKAFDNGKLNDLIEYAGRKAGVNFGTEFDHTVRAEVLSSLEKSLQKAVRSGSLDLSSILRGVNSGGGQIELLGPAIDDAVRAVKAAQDKMESDVAKSVAERVKQERIGEEMVAAIHANQARMWETLLDKREKEERAFTRFQGAEERARVAAAAKAAAEKLRLEKRTSAQQEKDARDYAKWWESALKAHDKYSETLYKNEVKRENALWDVRRKTATAYAKYLKDIERGKSDTFGNAVSGKSLGDRIGGLFGKGSRNNVLNTLGSSIGGIVKGVEGAVNGVRKTATSMFETFSTGFTGAAEGSSIFIRSLEGLRAVGGRAGGAISSMAKSAIAAAPAIAAAMIAVEVALSVLASVIGALVGLVTALAASIASALVGALLVAAPLIAAMIAGIGLLTAGFMSMTDAQKKSLSTSFAPLKDELKGLGQTVIRDVAPAFDNWANNLKRAIATAAPVAEVMGSAFARAGTIITKSLSGPGFQKFSRALARELPAITVNLSKAFGSLGNGLTATFAAIMPLVTQFSEYVRDAAEDFSKWANSAKGQNSIKDFADRAVKSLKSVWGAVKELGGFVSDILFSKEGQKAGNSIFDGIRDSVKSARKSIDRADLEKWFQDSIDFGKDLWGVIKSLKKVFQALYDSGVLEAVGDGVSFIADMLDLAATYADPMVRAFGVALPPALQASLGPISAIAGALGNLQGAIQTTMNLLDQLGLKRGHGGESPQAPDYPGGTASTPSTGGINGGNTRVASDWMLKGRRSNRGGKNQHLDAVAQHLINIGKSLDSKGDLVAQQQADAASDAAGGSGSGSDKKGRGKGDGKKWHNPYVKWARSLIKDGPSAAAIIKMALKQSSRLMTKAMKDGSDDLLKSLKIENKAVGEALTEAMKADSADSAKSTLAAVVESLTSQSQSAAQAIRANAQSTASTLRDSAKNAVDTAQGVLNDAASNLANASGPKQAHKALAAVKRAQKLLDAAEKAQKKINDRADKITKRAKDRAKRLNNRTDRAGDILDAQQVVNDQTVAALVAGMRKQNATLADYAAAREQIAAKIADANEALASAVQMQADYSNSVSDATRAYGALTTAQATVIDGIEQALTANDITSNLQTRLDKITAFRNNLRSLLALGLSDDAYKQLVDMGVEDGSAYVEALLKGGIGSVTQVNGLVSQIGTISDSLGTEAADRLYAAGVSAAQGLVDGLNSQAAALDKAAEGLGNSIAAAIARALGIKKKGKGKRQGEDIEAGAAGSISDYLSGSAGRISGRVAVSPEVAQYAASQRSAATVSGNGEDPRFRDLIVQTPSKDPKTVALEVMNEVTGRLP